ncbi:MAG TPA: poly-beta-1,6 N-acetyl-D-glucosamine export porin PgaA [Gammaproteobacteria bacterium]|nr:poly-beta-1,6 N-acetyl-D-glucosamine export porin PgaA [Gammaproteobacteria bacterium]
MECIDLIVKTCAKKMKIFTLKMPDLHVPLLPSRPAMALMVGLCAVQPAVSAPVVKALSNPGAEHRAAVAQARQGDYEVALKRLAALLTAYPENPVFRDDYISVLAWAGRDEEVLAQSSQVDFAQAPVYVLKAIGKSARNRQRPELAITAYDAVLQRDANDRQARLGLAMSLAEAKQPAEANAQMAALLKAAPNSVASLEALAYVKEADGDYAAAIAVYDRLLKTEPTHRGARRGRILSLLRLGVPHEAIRLARHDAEVFTVEDWQRMAGDQAAREIRWGRLPTVTPAERYRDTDSAIERLQAQYRQIADKDSAAALRNRFDLIAAYRNRRLMHEATALYEQLHEQGVTSFPPYVLAVTGDAYLSLRQPGQAVVLLEQSIDKNADDLDAQYSLFYAYLEAGQYEKSLAHIDRLVASLPPWIWPPGSKERQPGLDRLYAQTVAAMARAYVDKLDVAERRLKAQLARAPASSDVRNGLGSVYLWRGWPRQARDEFRAVLAVESENLGARIGMVSVLTARGDDAAADAALTPLLSDYADNTHVRNLARDAEVRKMREIWMEVSGGSSSSNVYQSSSDLAFATYYYDKPWNPGLRPFVYMMYREADFREQAVSRNRLAAGVDYRQQDMALRGSISDGNGSPGISLQGNWMPTDHWRGGLSLQSFSEQTPLRADLTGVEAWSLEASTEYRFHESRSLGLSLQTMGFDDNNRRNTLTAFARQRLINGLRYKLSGDVYLYHQTNTEEGTDYFNPSRQDSAELSLSNEWLTYRHYEKSMRQRLVAGVGPSRQQGFDTKLSWSLSYEHHWSFSRQFSLSYGITRAQPVYDGIQESTTRGFLNLYARF